MSQLDALLSRCEQVGDCWQWQGGLNRGYARTRLTKRGPQFYVHRRMYELMVADIPEGLSLDHLCRNTGCINPYHLDPVPHRVNVLRGVGPTADNARKTACGNCNAPYHRLRSGKKVCHPCAAARNREYRARKREPNA